MLFQQIGQQYLIQAIRFDEVLGFFDEVLDLLHQTIRLRNCPIRLCMIQEPQLHRGIFHEKNLMMFVCLQFL